MAAKLPAAPTTANGLRRRIPLDEPHGGGGQPAAEGDEGCLGPDDRAQGQAGQGRQGDARQLERSRVAAG